MCACLTLCLMAQAPRLSRSQLLQTPITKTHPGTPAAKRSVEADRFASSPSFNGLQIGSRIAKIDAYDFNWDDERGIATVKDSTAALMGKCCSIKRSPNGGWCLSDFFGEFDIPIEIDETAGTVKIKAGVALGYLYGESVDPSYLRTANHSITWALYAMPLSWLEGDDDYDDIHGVITDNSISFTDDFAFLVRETADSPSTSSTWGLSLIYSNVVLYKPNGIHSFNAFVVVTDSIVEYDFPTDEHSHGNGGIVPRPIQPRPGNTKPVTPRAFWNESRDRGNTESETVLLSATDEDNKISCHQPILSGSGSGNLPKQFRTEIYIYDLNDTTVMVYNLFGKDYCWNYLYKYPDQSIRFPDQEICRNIKDEPLYNCSKNTSVDNSLVWGNNGTYIRDVITWDNTYLCSEGGWLAGVYSNNKIVIGATLNDQNSELTKPEGLLVIPGSTFADVFWTDNVNTAWKLRYRRSDYAPLGSLLYDMNGEHKDAFDDWLVQDMDQDGDCWRIGTGVGSEGDYCFQSDSYHFGVVFEPDNWLFSPEVKLGGVLRFSAWGDSEHPENFRVYVQTMDNPEPQPLTGDLTTTGTKTVYEYDLSGYSGELGQIAFRHYNSSGNFYLKIDDIFIGNPNDQAIEHEVWNNVRCLDYEDYTIQGLTPSTEYVVQVKAIDDNGNDSDWTDLVSFTTGSLLGDVNKDGQVTISDVTTLVDHLLSNDYEESEHFSYGNSDITGEGNISIADVTALIDCLLSGLVSR